MISKNIIKEWLVIIGGTAIVAAAVFFFMLPSHVSVGSAAALAMLIGNFIPIPVSAITAGLNSFLLLIGFLLIGPEFGGKTVFTALLMPGFMWVFEFLFPNFQSITHVDKQEYKQLMDYVRKVDPKAFITVYSVNEINYQPKIRK